MRTWPRASSGSRWRRSGSASSASRRSRSLLEGPLGECLSHTVAVAIAITIAYLIVTFAHITVGEQVPKIWSIMHAETAATLGVGAARVVLRRSRAADLGAELRLERDLAADRHRRARASSQRVRAARSCGC